MSLTQVVVLALVQGLTEFLPVSSSAHLILVPALTGWPDQGIEFDVAVHVGTLAAVLWHFRRETVRLAGAGARSLAGRPSVEGRFAGGILLATVPLAAGGFFLHGLVESHLRGPVTIAAANTVFALVLGIADRGGGGSRAEHDVGWRGLLLVGVAQALALVPGTSRSGITITAGLLLGLSRTAAARVSFLLSIPAIVLAGGYETLRLLGAPQPVDWTVLLLGAVLSAASAWVVMGAFLAFVERIGLLPFVAYRLLLAVGIGAVLALSAG